MMQLNYYRRGNPGYDRVCAWARPEYLKELQISVARFPDILIAAEMQSGQVVGCIGLNESVRFSLFRNDSRCNMLLQALPVGYECCEQSVLIINRRFPRALPMLIAAAAYRAQVEGFRRVIFAGICSSMHTITELGLRVTEIGDVDLTVLPDDGTRANYTHWHTTLDPVHFLLDTGNAWQVQLAALQRYGKGKVTPCAELNPLWQQAPGNQPKVAAAA